MTVLHVLREYAEARSATLARRLYGYAVVAVLVGLVSGVIFAGVPIWLFWAVVILEAAVDPILVRRWIIRDAVARAASDRQSLVVAWSSGRVVGGWVRFTRFVRLARR